MNKTMKMVLLNAGIVATAIIAYSPGFLGLRPFDPSIFKAGMSIILGLGLVSGFGMGNYKLLQPEKRQILVAKENVVDISGAIEILEKFKSDKQYGKIAKTAIEQVDRLKRSTERAEMEIKAKFEPASMSYDKYYNVVEAAGTVALENLVSLANRIRLYDGKEYERLKSSYRDDNIPDDIQEKQLRLFEKNKALAMQSVAKNEELILNLDTLSMELTSANYESDGSGEALLTEIETLTNEVKYYI